MGVTETYQVHKRGNTESQIPISTSLSLSPVRQHRRFPSPIRSETPLFDSQSTPKRSLRVSMRGPPTFLTAILPSFISRSLGTGATATAKRSTNKIAALDGLRGVACLFVFHAHYAYSFGNCLEEVAPEITSQRFMYQPFIFLLWSGIAMVDIFFFISGYVLVSKALRLIRADDVAKALSTISSAVFRRALRLYLPSMAIILIAALLTRMRFFDAGRIVFYTTSDGVVGPQESPPPYLQSLLAQTLDALKDCYRMVDNSIPWGRFNFPYEDESAARPAATVYDKHLWTIPVEFKCSMLIFIILIGTAQISASWRLVVHATISLHCLLTERFSECLFVAGMLFAEVDMIRQENTGIKDPYQGIRVAEDSTSRYLVHVRRVGDWLSEAKPAQNLVSLSIFVTGLFLLSVPPQGPEVFPAYRSIIALLPRYLQQKDRVIRAIGAIMTTWPVATSPILAPLFTNPISHYLGQISFAMYLVHGTIIKGMWYALLPGVSRAITGVNDKSVMTSGQFIATWLTGYMIVFPTVLWAADIFWRGIDKRSIIMARWVEKKLSHEV